MLMRYLGGGVGHVTQPFHPVCQSFDHSSESEPLHSDDHDESWPSVESPTQDTHTYPLAWEDDRDDDHCSRSGRQSLASLAASDTEGSVSSASESSSDSEDSVASVNFPVLDDNNETGSDDGYNY
jgi:hypothetical protein